MSCFSCFSSHEKRASKRFDAERGGSPSPRTPTQAPPERGNELCKSPAANHTQNAQNATAVPEPTPKEPSSSNIAAQTFTFRELASATKNFRPDNLLGEGGFGRVYKGFLEKSGQHVAIKQLDRSGVQGNKEFLVEVLMLSLLNHQNLVNLKGYCADGAQRLLVFEYMPLGSLANHLLEISPDQNPLSWYIRMKVAFDAAKGLEYLHEKANPPIIVRDFKSSNILLDENYEAKLSDFGLAKLRPAEDKLHASLMGTYGYCAPEYTRTGQFTMKSDIYSFGVVLLELITGRRAIDTSKPTNEQNLVTWAQPKFKDQRRYHELVDPLLQGDYPERGLNQAVAVAAMCLQEEAEVRPFMTDVIVTLSHLTGAPSSVGSSGRHHDNQSQSSQEEEEEDDDSDDQHG